MIYACLLLVAAVSTVVCDDVSKRADGTIACDPALRPAIIQNGFYMSSPDTMYNDTATYPPDQQCDYKISLTGGTMLTFDFFELEASTDCTKDSLTVFDGPDDTFPVLAVFCGTRFIRSRVLPLNAEVFLRFRSDSSIEGRGFVAHVEAGQPNDACAVGMMYNGVTSGNITSTNFPIRYPNNQLCTWWIINGDPAIAVEFYFSAMDLEASCDQFDKVEVYEGYSEENNLIGIWDGPTEFNDFKFRNYRGVGITVVFFSDANTVGDGFRMLWDFVTRDDVPVIP